MAIADDALNAARAHANQFWIALAYYGYGVAFTETGPALALDTFRLGLAYTRQHRLPHFAALIASEAAGLEAVHGDLDRALTLFTASVDSFHQAGDPTDLAGAFAHLAMFYARINRPEIAATLYGTTTHHPSTHLNFGFTAAVDHVRDTLDTAPSTTASPPEPPWTPPKPSTTPAPRSRRSDPNWRNRRVPPAGHHKRT